MGAEKRDMIPVVIEDRMAQKVLGIMAVFWVFDDVQTERKEEVAL